MGAAPTDRPVPPSQRPLLEVRDLNVRFVMEGGTVMAVNGASFSLDRGETVCVVGETGAGKSVTAFSVLRLLGAGGVSQRARLDGDIVFRPPGGREYHILSLSDEELRSIRGRQIAMIYQEPMTSLNPVYTCGNQISEVLRRHHAMSRGEAEQVAEKYMKLVGIPDAGKRLKSYPHQLSGGMQRVMIAMALALQPHLLIADEPTTAVDVTIQAQILNLFQEIQRTLGTAILFITHDISVVAQLADRVIVMYAGRTVEIGTVYQVFGRPLHPYTKGLLGSVPNPSAAGGKPRRLRAIPGVVPNPAALPPGCPFHPRCAWVEGRCRQEVPEREPVEDGHSVMCWNWLKIPGVSA
jgi:oligopeptide/dipeptide ABC transporter ATP-binding protein